MRLAGLKKVDEEEEVGAAGCLSGVLQEWGNPEDSTSLMAACVGWS